jgi:hypothetical protein
MYVLQFVDQQLFQNLICTIRFWNNCWSTNCKTYISGYNQMYHYIKPPSPFFRAKQKTAGPLFSENMLQSLYTLEYWNCCQTETWYLKDLIRNLMKSRKKDNLKLKHNKIILVDFYYRFKMSLISMINAPFLCNCYIIPCNRRGDIILLKICVCGWMGLRVF